MVHLGPQLRRGVDIRSLPNGRVPIPRASAVGFQERIPLALRNHVKGTVGAKKAKACVPQMIEMMSCLERVDQNQAMCQKEIQSFQNCFETFKAQELAALEARGKLGAGLTGSNVRLSSGQMTSMLRKFPTSQRRTAFYYEKPTNRDY
eukprot:maker-scaffold579_size130606-snap-gene-0.30 protein:Tk02368 transcript:maker-scaffold579_size130606-snap-gene-0.30-mRNA-1 annotation:"AGAP008073-PA"